jgi:hypothetical protein
MLGGREGLLLRVFSDEMGDPRGNLTSSSFLDLLAESDPNGLPGIRDGDHQVHCSNSEC